jgi:hypothetical protein
MFVFVVVCLRCLRVALVLVSNCLSRSGQIGPAPWHVAALVSSRRKFEESHRLWPSLALVKKGDSEPVRIESSRQIVDPEKRKLETSDLDRFGRFAFLIFLVHLCLLNPFDAIAAFTFHANCCGPRSWLRGDSEFSDLALMKIVASESRSLFVRCCSSAQEILKCGSCKWPTCHDSNFLDVDPGQLSCGTAHCLHDTGRWIRTYWYLLMSCLVLQRTGGC